MRNAGLDEAQAGVKIQFSSVQFSCSVVSDSLLGEISITSDMQMTPLLWQKVKKNPRAS